MARKHKLELRELRHIRMRFVIILLAMAAVTVVILAYLALRVFVRPERIEYLDFASLCFYGVASFLLTIGQLAFFRHLTLGAGPRIEQMTHTDDLTGLGNRRHTAKFLAEEFREAQLSKNPITVVYIDVDDFKEVNDAHGHRAGDLLLRAIGHALKESIRENDFVGRVGGDEFVLVLPDTDSQCASVVAHRIAERLSGIVVTAQHADVGEPRTIHGASASIGISSYPVNANSRRELLEDADRTMYAAKHAGKGNIVISIARPAGPEPRASAANITQFEVEIGRIVGTSDQTEVPPETTDG